MQHVAPPPTPSPPVPPDVVRAMRGDSVEAPFRAALEHGALLHRHMVRARAISARMVALQRAGKIGYHTTSIGEEAAIVGAVLAMRSTDWIFPGAREWYAALARGLPLATYVHHAFGSAQDPARGHAAPDHVPAKKLHVVPPSGVIGAHLPQAVGAAWAAKIRREDVAALALFGAEVAEGGDFHNALNFAGVFKAPVVFVCRTGSGRASGTDRAVAYGLANARVDGGDALAVFTVVQAALARATEGKGATLVEVVSPVLPKLAALADDGVLESTDLLDLGAEDPLTRLRRVLVNASPEERSGAIAEEARVELDEAILAAERAGAPAPATIFEHVFANVPAHLAAQKREMRDGG
jgi:pyruvate dehydrogenase E1 component alpha subunit